MVREVYAKAESGEPRRRILYIGEDHACVDSLDLVRAPLVADAYARLGEERFSVVVVNHDGCTKEEVRRLGAIDPEMYLLIAASEAGAVKAGAFASDCKADGVVRFPLSRQELALALERASRLSSRVVHCVQLFELSRSLFGTLKQRDLVRTVLDIAPRTIAADNVALFLLSSFCESPASFECHTTQPPSPELRGFLADVTSLVSERGTMLSNEAVRGLRPTEPWRWLGCPLVGAEGTGGAVVFLRALDQGPFTPHERHAATTFASTVASALDNARDYREVESKVRTLARERHRAVAREAVSIARNLGGAVAHEVTNAMTVVANNVDALAHAVRDQELWQVAKEAAEFLLQQGEPTGYRLATRLMDAGGARNTDGLVTEIAGMIDECLQGVRRVSEMAHGLGVLPLPTRGEASEFHVSELFQMPLVSRAVVHRAVVVRNAARNPLAGSKSDVAEALACVLRAVDADAFAIEARDGRAERAPLVVHVEDTGSRCTVRVDAPFSLESGATLQSLLAPRLRVKDGNVFRFDASLSLAHALLARNALDLWVECREDGNTSLVISAAAFAA